MVLKEEEKLILRVYDSLRCEGGAVSVADIQALLGNKGAWVYSPPTIRKVLRKNNRETT